MDDSGGMQLEDDEALILEDDENAAHSSIQHHAMISHSGSTDSKFGTKTLSLPIM